MTGNTFPCGIIRCVRSAAGIPDARRRRQHAQTISCRECGPAADPERVGGFRKQAGTGTDLAGQLNRETLCRKELPRRRRSGRRGRPRTPLLRRRFDSEGGRDPGGEGDRRLSARLPPGSGGNGPASPAAEGKGEKALCRDVPVAGRPCGVRAFCEVSRQEEELLTAPARPIVLLERKKAAEESFCPSLSSESSIWSVSCHTRVCISF